VSRFVAGHLLKIGDVAATEAELDDLIPRERAGATLIARATSTGKCMRYSESPKDLGDPHENVFDKLGVASHIEVTFPAFETGFV
jgi:hypothetical protein